MKTILKDGHFTILPGAKRPAKGRWWGTLNTAPANIHKIYIHKKHYHTKRTKVGKHKRRDEELTIVFKSHSPFDF